MPFDHLGSTLALVAGCVAIETVEQSLYRMAGRAASRKWRFLTPAIVLHVCGLLLFYLLLKITPLSVALPMLGLQYVTIALAARWLFGERVDARRWLGIAIIVAGFVLIASSESAP